MTRGGVAQRRANRNRLRQLHLPTKFGIGPAALSVIAPPDIRALAAVFTSPQSEADLVVFDGCLAGHVDGVSDMTEGRAWRGPRELGVTSMLPTYPISSPFRK